MLDFTVHGGLVSSTLANLQRRFRLFGIFRGIIVRKVPRNNASPCPALFLCSLSIFICTEHSQHLLLVLCSCHTPSESIWRCGKPRLARSGSEPAAITRQIHSA